MQDKIVHGINLVLSYLANLPDNYYLHAGIFFGSVLTLMGAVEFWKRHQKKKLELEADVKKIVAKSLVAVSFAITAASYFLVFKNAVSPGFVIQYPAELIGVATLLYNLRTNKVYLALKDRLGQWSNDGKQLNTDLQAPVAPQGVTPPTTSPLDDLI